MFRLLAIDILHDSIFELVQKLPDVQFDYQPHWKRDEILANISQYDGLIVRSKTAIDAAFLQQATALKLIARAGSGLDLIDLEMTKKMDIQCVNAPEGNRDAVAEHTLGLLLALMHKTAVGNAQVKQGQWLREENRGYELKNKTVGIIGYGNVGSEVAKRLSAFGCKILAYDIRPKQHPIAAVEEVSMERIFQEVDVLTLHVPLTDATRQMVDAAYLAQFAKPIWLINTSRGEVVQLKAVCEALGQARLQGVGLDVLENERINALTTEQQQDFDYLAQHHLAILTPHIAGWTFESYQRINEVLVEKIDAFLKYARS